MKAIEFQEVNVTLAKDQPEYVPIPAYGENFMLVYCLELEPLDIADMVEKKSIELKFLNSGTIFQPVRMELSKPKMPGLIPWGGFWANPKIEPVPEHRYLLAKILIPLEDEDIEVIKETRQIWLTTATFNQPIQPIQLPYYGYTGTENQN